MKNFCSFSYSNAGHLVYRRLRCHRVYLRAANEVYHSIESRKWKEI